MATPVLCKALKLPELSTIEFQLAQTAFTTIAFN
jgi:hypothetical protein